MKSFLYRLWSKLVEEAHDMAFGRAIFPTVTDLRRYAASSPDLPIDQDKTEVRIYATFITVVAVLLSFEPIWYLYSVPESMVSRVATLAPSPLLVSLSFGVALLGVLPHLCTLVFFPRRLRDPRFRQWAALSSLLGAVTWMWLAYMAVPMDVGGLEYAYGIRAVVTLCIGFMFAFSVNAQQLRDIIKRLPHEGETQCGL